MRKLITSACAIFIGIVGVASAETKGIFRQAHEYGFGENSSLDPISKGRVFQITEKVMNRLVRPNMDGQPSPDLAISWEANSDATIWTLKLRQGVKFHDGSDFDAADVVYSLKRVLAPELASPARSAVKMITSVEAVDAETVKLSLDTSFADLPLQLMDYRLMMLPEGSGETIASTGIGTGPFKLVKFDAAATTILEANMDYYAGAPGVERMEIIGIPDGQARLQALLGGQIDMESGITAQQRPMLASSSKYAIQDVPTGNWRGIVFRTDVAPFNDPRVRKAMRIVADRNELLALAEGGNGVIACDTPVGPKDQYAPNLICPQDVAGAKALLAEAGFPDGLDVDVYLSTLEPTWPTMVEVYQGQAAKAGIRIKIVLVPTDGFWKDVWMQKDAVTTRWNERTADSALHEIYLSTAKWNESYYKDAGFDELLAQSRRELDFNKRKTLYVEAQKHLFETSGTLIPYHVTKLVGTTARVKNLDAVENFAIRWDKITLED